MTELQKLLARLAVLEKLTERTADQDKELDTAKTRVAVLEKESKDNADKTTARLAEMERKEAIRAVADQFDVDKETTRTYVEDASKTVQHFKDALFAERMAKTPDVPVNVLSADGHKDMIRAIEDSMVLRLGGVVANPHKDIDKYRGASLLDVARAITGETSFNKEQIAARSLVTADFPNLLLGAGNRMIAHAFEVAATTYQKFVIETDVQDFRENSDLTLGEGGRLDEITEGGELKEKPLGETAEKWKIKSYGNKFSLTRQMIINDDLGAFTDMVTRFVKMASRTANGLVYDLLMKRGKYLAYTMSDAVPIFHADHKNLAGAALSATTLAAGRAAMQKHLSSDDETPLNITPAYLIVGPDLEQTAYELVNSISKVEDNKSSGVTNYHQGSVEVIVDAEVTGSQWFLSASTNAIKVGYLAGTGRRPLLRMNDSTLTKTEFEGVFDFGVVASDYRGLYAGNGVA